MNFEKDKAATKGWEPVSVTKTGRYQIANGAVAECLPATCKAYVGAEIVR